MRFLSFLLPLLIALPAWAQGDVQSELPIPEPRFNTSELEAIYDAYFDPEGPLSYTGAAVAIVQDGQIIVSKGYGFADAERRNQVNADTTAFPVGSVTKTWAGTLLAQLVAEREMSLDDPVNTHLTRTQIPNNDGEPITLRHLSTHQAGFADWSQPFMKPGDTPPTFDGRYIDSQTPPFIRPVESGSVYSNFGIALLGWALEDATGETLADLLETRIFDPANMDTARIIEGPNDRRDSAQGELFYPNGGRRAAPTEWANNPANRIAGGGVISAGDMARYMIGLMDGTLLSPEGRTVAFTRQGETHPLLQGFGSVFMLNDWNGVQIAEHGGRTLAASSYMTLLPEERIGLFVVATGEGGTILPAPALLGKAPAPAPIEDAKLPVRQASLSAIRALGLEALLGRYEPPIPTNAIDIDMTDYVGAYLSERRPGRTPTALFRRFFLGGAPLQSFAAEDGGLRFGYYGLYDAVAPDIFYKRDAREGKGASGWSDLLVFRRGPDGDIIDAATTYTDAVFAKQSAGSGLPWTLLKWGGLIVILTGLLALIWPKGTRGRWPALALPIAILALPILFFRSWPRFDAEALGYLTLSASDLWGFRLLGTLIAAACLWIAFSALRTLSGKGFRRTFALWHRRLLGIAGAAFTIGLIVFGVTI